MSSGSAAGPLFGERRPGAWLLACSLAFRVGFLLRAAWVGIFRLGLVSFQRNLLLFPFDFPFNRVAGSKGSYVSVSYRTYVLLNSLLQIYWRGSSGDLVSGYFFR
jgi:hypothetical protein